MMRATAISAVIIAMLLSGCAGTAPKATFVNAPSKTSIVDANDTIKVSITMATGVEILDQEKQRLSVLVAQKVQERKMRNATGGDPESYDVEVELTRYEKGNAFARAMLAGLGQIHIDAKVRLMRADKHEKVSDFELKKTFAWGGIYGAVTGIEDVEPAFAEGIAAALTGTPDAPAPDNAKN